MISFDEDLILLPENKEKPYDSFTGRAEDSVKPDEWYEEEEE